jgi:PAS domain S-box-containing protein
MKLEDLNQEKDEESLKKHTDGIEFSEKHLSLICDSLFDVIFLLAVEPDDCFRFVSVNQAFLVNTGLTREQVVGKRIEQVLPETVHPLVISKYKEAINENKSVFWEQTSPFPTGELVGAVTVSPVRTAEEVCTCLVGSVHDITESKKAEKILQRSEALLNATQQLSKVGGWEWDVETQTMFWTDEVYRIHDFQPSEFKSGSIEHIEQSIECYDPSDRPVIMEAFRNCAENGQVYDLEFPFTTSMGRKRWIRTVAKPVLKDKRIVKVIGNIMDITERKQAEDELQKRMNELETFYRTTLGREERVIELKQEVNQLLEQLGKNKKYRDYS